MSTVCTWVRACAASTTFSSLDWRRRRVPMGCLKTIKETVWLKSSGRHLNHALYVNTSLTLCRFNGELTTIEWFPCLTGCIWWRRWRLNMHDRTTMHLDKRKKESLCLPHGISSCCDVYHQCLPVLAITRPNRLRHAHLKRTQKLEAKECG